MQFKYHWIPPFKANHRCKVMGNELLIPYVEDDYKRSEVRQECITTRFGFWALDLSTGAERRIVAPFSLQEAYMRAGKCTWFSMASYEGALVMTLKTKHSYDFRYHFFTFDGTTWKQVLDPGPTQSIVFHEQSFKTWHEPGRLELSAHPLVGGALACAENPLTFAADFTHAFAYDSGPMSPSAPEYTALRAKEVESTKKKVCHRPFTLADHPERLKGLPKAYLGSKEDTRLFRFITLPKGRALISFTYAEGLKSLSIAEA